MTKTLMLFGVAAMFASAAGAATQATPVAAKPNAAAPAKPTMTTAKPAAKPAMTAAKPAAAAPAKPAMTAPMAPARTASTRSTKRAAPAETGRMVSFKTSTGKTITYNCSKPGNANKKACK